MKLNEEFQIHDKLNPKIWDDAGQLRPEVKEGIIKIVKQFESELKAPIAIVDIQICGSNASYNYVDSMDYASDLDVHIIANFDIISDEVDLLHLVYDLSKSKFKKDHNITIHGVPIELYVQDINAGVVSNGIYSVLDNKWVKEPKPINSASKKNVEKELEAWRAHIAALIQNQDEKGIFDAINSLHLIRHDSLATEGEYGKGTTLFKELRSEGLIKRLKDEYKVLVDKKLTVENLSAKEYTNGQLIERIDEGLNYKCSCDVFLPGDRKEHFEDWYYANSEEKAINQMKHFVHEKYGYNVYIRDIKVKL